MQAAMVFLFWRYSSRTGVDCSDPNNKWTDGVCYTDDDFVRFLDVYEAAKKGGIETPDDVATEVFGVSGIRQCE